MTLYAKQKNNLKDPDRTIRRFPRPSHLASPQKYGDGQANELMITAVCYGTFVAALGLCFYNIDQMPYVHPLIIALVFMPLPTLFALIPPWRAWQRRRMLRISEGSLDVKEPKSYAAANYHVKRAFTFLGIMLICVPIFAFFIIGFAAGTITIFGRLWGCVALATILMSSICIGLRLRHTNKIVVQEPEEEHWDVIDHEDTVFKLSDEEE